ncbi:MULTISPECIES: bifunctional folylpolyglutamate synthase/dihydrofolate synthase [Brevibacterium]|jgi:dihydrofolate synthase/folylpolyglutamate synthase|uniref:tetrahydrofolate synthase n=2 Tax=Brevibacterium TaxID=1696 RepID=A0A0B9A001_BRELN|nr:MULTISPECIES: folylpolyglutamate synthase/dihydrofolate synthase family protein [Brevibacterium]KHS51909.1 FolC bifunctional protein [Brevibacterium linens]HJE76492.1 bifunctional folylpolyglutamate synthase/dihydrofolate synthase [Brevibacterium epidermidis]
MSDDNTPAEDPVSEAEELLAAVEDPQTADEAEPEPLPEPVVDEATRAELARVYALLLARAGETQIELRLDATRWACEVLGDIHTAAPTITITGTNGKTSTARMIDSLITAHDLRVGRFTSPHLHSVTERISVDGSPVSARTFVRIYDEIAPYLEIVDGQLEAEGRAKLTYFEALTVLAFAVFADAPVDVVVTEVGMGGAWDSTNVADAQVCVFTKIGLDHQAFLGDTIEEIAATKAGILDRSVEDSPAPKPVAVTAVQDEAAQAVLDEEAARREVPLATEERDFRLLDRQRAVDGQLITVQGRRDVYSDLFLPLHGVHQAHNATVAIVAAEAFLGAEDKPLDQETVAEGLARVTSPGRAELVRTGPSVVVDGAHNPDAAHVLAETLTEAFDFDYVVMVLAMLADKDSDGVIEELHRSADVFVVSENLNSRALPVDDLAEVAREWVDEDSVIVASDLNAALMKAIDLANSVDAKSPGIVVTGSIYTVAEARLLLGRGEER